MLRTLLFMVCLPLCGQTPLQMLHDHPAWSASLAAYFAASAADAGTSAYLIDYRKAGVEINPVINRVNGTNTVFGPGGFAVKGAAFAGLAIVETAVLRKWGARRPWLYTLAETLNFSGAGVFGVETIRNGHYIRVLK